LNKLMEGRTSIIIAHRLSTIMNADVIVVMDKGRIVQKGNHRTLKNKPGMYRKLWNLQKSADALQLHCSQLKAFRLRESSRWPP
jgi:ABC-type multidrug transport system fused ATPase/permease subunit